MRAIAFRAPNWLGDAVLATLIPPALNRAEPTARLHVLVPRGLGDVYVRAPGVERVVEFGKGEEVDAYRRGGYDRVLIAPESFGSAWRARRAGIPERVGLATAQRRILLTRSWPAAESSRARHQVENYRVLARLATSSEVDDSPHVVLDEGWVAEAHELWPERGVCRVALMPGAAYGSAKRWFPERFAAVARALAAEGLDVALVGGAGDRDVIDRVMHDIPSGVRDLAGRTRVGVLAAVLSGASLLITNDTGPMHLAAAVGTPSLALFGSTSPTWTRPWGDANRVLSASVPCAPCFQRTCRFGAPCFERISTEDVLRTALAMIGRAP